MKLKIENLPTERVQLDQNESIQTVLMEKPTVGELKDNGKAHLNDASLAFAVVAFEVLASGKKISQAEFIERYNKHGFDVGKKSFGGLKSNSMKAYNAYRDLQGWTNKAAAIVLANPVTSYLRPKALPINQVMLDERKNGKGGRTTNRVKVDNASAEEILKMLGILK